MNRCTSGLNTTVHRLSEASCLRLLLVRQKKDPMNDGGYRLDGNVAEHIAYRFGNQFRMAGFPLKDYT